MDSRKGIPNKETRYDSDILPRLSDIKEWLMQGDAVREVPGPPLFPFYPI